MATELADVDLVLEEDAERPTIDFTCLDTDGAAISLSGATLKLVVYDPYSGAAVITLTTASGLAISGASNNIVTATFTTTHTAAAGSYRYQLRRTASTNLTLFRGAFTIRKGPQITW